MTTSPARFHLVVGVDLSEYAEAVLEHAYDEAVRHDRPSLHVVAVAGKRVSVEAVGEALVALVRESLDVVPPERRAEWTILLHVRSGAPEQEIVELAAEVHADRIVVGRFGVAPHTRGVASVADRVVVLADCPVLVVPPPRDTSSSDLQCLACVGVRRESGGEQWFCAHHHGEWRGHLVLAPPFVNGGRGLW
jgi:nucleotide-binding universal stress UspA family protein